MFLEFASCQLPNYAENANFQIRISQNAKNPFYAPLLVNPRYVSIVSFMLCVCACTQAVRRAHTRTLRAHINVPSKTFLHIIISYMTRIGEATRNREVWRNLVRASSS